jgi:hypothetical protein
MQEEFASPTEKRLDEIEHYCNHLVGSSRLHYLSQGRVYSTYLGRVD